MKLKLNLVRFDTNCLTGRTSLCIGFPQLFYAAMNPRLSGGTEIGVLLTGMQKETEIGNIYMYSFSEYTYQLVSRVRSLAA